MKTILPPAVLNEIRAYISECYSSASYEGQVDDRSNYLPNEWYEAKVFSGCTVHIVHTDKNSVFWYLVSSKTLPTVEITTKGGCLLGVKADCHLQVRYIDLDEEDSSTMFNAEFVNKL